MKPPITQKDSEFLIYEGKDGKTVVDVRFEGQDIWLTQDQLAMLFGVERAGITQHIRNIFAEGELQEISVGKKFLRTAADGKNAEQYLLFAQTQARRRIAMTMQDWIDKIHGFLTLNERTILLDAGRISHELAKQHAEKEYDVFRIKQAQIPYNTDFEKFIEESASKEL